jgi:hypothetical protein
LELDPEFFGRELQLPTGKNTLVDECEVYSRKHTGEPVITLARRVICPRDAVDEATALLREMGIPVVTFDALH